MPCVQAVLQQEFVPFQPHVEGPLLVVLHIAKTLPRYIAATTSLSTAATTAAAATDGSPSPPSPSSSSPLAAVFGGLSGVEAAAAARRLADPASLGKLKRDLYFRWVQGSLGFAFVPRF